MSQEQQIIQDANKWALTFLFNVASTDDETQASMVNALEGNKKAQAIDILEQLANLDFDEAETKMTKDTAFCEAVLASSEDFATVCSHDNINNLIPRASFSSSSRLEQIGTSLEKRGLQNLSCYVPIPA